MKIDEVDFAEFTDTEQAYVDEIVRRAAEKDMLFFNKLSLEMDLAATHYTCPLDLRKLSEADDVTFAHDIGGIQGHLNRDTGYLTDHFLPKTAQPIPA